jgi:hypothetical protein
MDTRTARQLLAELELISHGSTAAWDSSGGHSAEKPLMPAGEPNPPHIALRAQLDAALTQSQVDKVTQKARLALRAARYTPIRDEPRLGDPLWRRYVVQSPKSVADIARFYNVDESYIRRVRREAA